MVPARRRAAVAAGCAVVAFISAAGFATLYASAGRAHPALIVTRTVVQGQPFTSSDLSETDATVGPGVVALPVGDAAWLRGKSAAVTVPAGSLLTPGDVTAAPSIPSGQAVVGIALKEGQLPAAGAATGQPVMLVETGSPGTPLAASVTGTGTGSGSGSGAGAGGGGDAGSGSVARTSAAVLVARATVFAVAAPTQNTAVSGSTVVSVLVPIRLAPVVATAAAADQVSLVVLASGGAGGPGASS